MNWRPRSSTVSGASREAAATELEYMELVNDAGDVVASFAEDVDGNVTMEVAGMLAVETLTDGATITWTFNGSESRNAKVTLGGNRTLALSGCSPGASGTLIVVQGSGGQTLALPSGSYVVNAGAGVATLSSGAADRDVLSFLYVSATEIYWTVGLDFTAT